MTDPIAAFWNDYLAAHPDEPRRNPPPAWHFCDNEQDANELGALVVAGTKTATCGLLWSYEAEGEAVPQVGEWSIIIDWDRNPLCVIETTEVTMRPYNEVDARFAADEGEGDRSLAYWRAVHWRVFSAECATIGRAPADSMPLVCERFHVLYVP